VPNPRIDELRKRLEKEPGSRLFAQLAEELRKDGDLEEAVRICREGLEKHTNYPSARMTLGRALFDSGDLAGARDELASVLKGAPDNILASRLLADALEGLGDLAGAQQQLKKTLMLAPGDKAALARLEEIEGRLGGGAVPAAAGPPAGVPAPSAAPPAGAPRSVPPTPAPGAGRSEPPEAHRGSRSVPPGRPIAGPAPALSVVAAAMARAAAARGDKAAGTPSQPPKEAPVTAPAERPPIPLVEAEAEFELERPSEAPPGASVAGDVARSPARAPEDDEATVVVEATPIPLAQAEEEFELERPYEAAPVRFEGEAAPEPPAGEAAPAAPEAGEAPIPLVEAEQEFELERPYESAPVVLTGEEPPDTVALKPAGGEAASEEVLEFDEAPTIVDVPAYKVEEAPVVSEAPAVAEAADEVEARPETIPFAAPAAAAKDDLGEAETREPAVEPEIDVEEAGPTPAPLTQAEMVAVPTPPPEEIASAAASAAEPPAAEAAPEEIASATLAELYFSQGFSDKAVEVYRALLEREPGNERARTRIAEIEVLEREVLAQPEEAAGAPQEAQAPDSRAARRAAVERAIMRLEAMLAAVRKE